MALKEVSIKITAKVDEAIAAMKKLQGQFETTSKKSQDAIDGIDKSLKGVGAAAVGNALGSIALAIGNVGLTSIKAANQMRSYEIAFSTMLKSADKGRVMLQDLQRFAAETPFDVPGVVQAAQQLMAFGFAADEIIPTLRVLGDTAAGLGKSSAGVQQIAYALGQIRTSGTLKTQDVNQLTNAGINAWEALAQASGKSIREIKEATEKGMIDSARAIEVITASMADNFGGMMEARSKEADGYWNNIVESVGNAQATLGSFATEGEGVKETLKDISEEASDVSNALMEAKNAGKSFKEAIKEAVPPEVVVAIGSLAAILGATLVAAIGTATIALAGFLGLTAPIVAGVAAIGGAVAGIYTYWEEISEAIDIARGALQRFVDTPLGQLIPTMKDYIASVKETKAAQDELASYSKYDSDYHDSIGGSQTGNNATDLFDKGKNKHQEELRQLAESYRITATHARELARANSELKEAQNSVALNSLSGAAKVREQYRMQIEAIREAAAVERAASSEKIANLQAQMAVWEQAKAAGIDGSEQKIANLATQIAQEQQLADIREQIAKAQETDIKEKMEEEALAADKVSQAWLNYGQSVANGFGDAVESILTGSQTASKAFADMARQMLLQSIKLFAQWQMIFALVSAFKGPKVAAETANKMVLGLADGGYVSGAGTSTSDSIPAMLSNGEYVMRASAVRQIGLPTLNAMNEGRGFADGGLVSAKPVGVGVAQGGSRSVTLNVSTIDADSFDRFLDNGGLDKIKQHLFDSDRNFAGLAGVW